MQDISKTRKKKEAKSIEKLAGELAALSANELSKLPCDEIIVAEIKKLQALKQFSARRRQLKFLSKLLRNLEATPLFDHLEKNKKSHLKQDILFHQLEHLRNRILNEENEEEALEEVKEKYPELYLQRLKDLAHKYRWTRNKKYS